MPNRVIVHYGIKGMKWDESKKTKLGVNRGITEAELNKYKQRRDSKGGIGATIRGNPYDNEFDSDEDLQSKDKSVKDTKLPNLDGKRQHPNESIDDYAKREPTTKKGKGMATPKEADGRLHIKGLKDFNLIPKSTKRSEEFIKKFAKRRLRW